MELTDNTLEDTLKDNKVVVSACKNSDSAIKRIKDMFGDKVEVCRIQDLYTVNVTFNKTVQEKVKKYGAVDG